MYSVAVSASAFGLSNTMREASPPLPPPPPPTDRAKRPEKMKCSLELQVFMQNSGWISYLTDATPMQSIEVTRMEDIEWSSSHSHSNPYCSEAKTHNGLRGLRGLLFQINPPSFTRGQH